MAGASVNPNVLSTDSDRESASSDDESPKPLTKTQERKGGNYEGIAALVSPFDVRFSQSRIRTQFRDHQSLETAIEDTKMTEIVIHTDEDGRVLHREASFTKLVPGAVRHQRICVLRPPFPSIELTRWRAKLRDREGFPMRASDGRPQYAAEALTTYDNRRLYCLQRVAARVHSRFGKHVYAPVTFIDAQTTMQNRHREIRKFRTVSLGLSVQLGMRNEGELPKFCLAQEVGCEDADADSDARVEFDAGQPARLGTVRSVHAQLCPPGEGAPAEGVMPISRSGRKRWSRDPSFSEDGTYVGAVEAPRQRSMFKSAMLFAAIYVVCRIMFGLLFVRRRKESAEL